MWPHPEVFTLRLRDARPRPRGARPHTPRPCSRPRSPRSRTRRSCCSSPSSWTRARARRLAKAERRRRRSWPPSPRSRRCVPAALLRVAVRGHEPLGATLGGRARACRPSRALDLAIDPNLGLLPHAPLTLAARRRSARSPRSAAKTAAPALLVLAARPARSPSPAPRTATGTTTPSGPSRYVVWIVPDPRVRGGRRASAGGPSARRDVPLAWALGARARHAGGRRPRARRPARALGLPASTRGRRGSSSTTGPRSISPAPEVFVERTLGHEGPFEGPVVYRDAAAAVARPGCSGATPTRLVAACGEPPGACGRTPAGEPRAPATRKRDWTYVDY